MKGKEEMMDIQGVWYKEILCP